jgi:hypothetical protein
VVAAPLAASWWYLRWRQRCLWVAALAALQAQAQPGPRSCWVVAPLGLMPQSPLLLSPVGVAATSTVHYVSPRGGVAVRAPWKLTYMS